MPTEALGRICVAEDEDENIWLKQVKPGSAPGLFHLISINPTSLNLHDIRLTWASPVRFYLPPDMVERLERGAPLRKFNATQDSKCLWTS